MKPVIKFITAIIVPLGVGAIGSYFTSESLSNWFTTLNKPSFNPPDWIFFPVWTTLYILMGIAFFLVWNSHTKLDKKYTACAYYWIQLVLNFLWSIIFFGLRNPGLALVDIVLLFIMIAGTIMSFRKVSKTAAWLLAPYILWVAFATVLNFQIWRLN